MIIQKKLPRNISNCGLLAARPVRWLLGNEPDVREAVRKFIIGETNTDYIDVATPPDWAEQMMARLNPRRPIMLPLVRLRMKMVERIDGWFCEVTTSDREMEVLVAMERAKIASEDNELDVMRRFAAKA